MSKAPFVTLVFRGARFDGAVMPLETLPELAAYRELVLAVARALFQAQNPDRKRLPKGFEAGFKLVLDKKIEEGSAVPVVSRVLEQSPSLFPEPPARDIFDDARDLVEQAIAAGSSSAPLPKELSQDVLIRFNAFGRTLRANESIVVARPGTRRGAEYNAAVRRKLVLCAHQSYEDEVDLVGEVRSADKDAEGFALRTSDGRRIDVRAPPLFFPLALRSLGDAAQVRVRGTGLFDAEGTLQRILLASDVSFTEEDDGPAPRPGCPTPIETQVDSLKGLGAGWYDEASPSYDPAALEWLAQLLKGLLEAFELPTPYVYPTPEGLARLEWSAPTWEVIAGIDLVEKTSDVIAVRRDSDELHELGVAFKDPGAESKLGRFLVIHLQPR